jgi:hypothetical protein
MAQIPIDAKRASHRECVRYIGTLQAENGQLRQQLGQANFYIQRRLSEWPYSWINRLWPFLRKPKAAKRVENKPAVKVHGPDRVEINPGLKKEVANG